MQFKPKLHVNEKVNVGKHKLTHESYYTNLECSDTVSVIHKSFISLV